MPGTTTASLLSSPLSSPFPSPSDETSSSHSSPRHLVVSRGKNKGKRGYITELDDNGDVLTLVLDERCGECKERGITRCIFSFSQRKPGFTCDTCHSKHRRCSSRKIIGPLVQGLVGEGVGLGESSSEEREEGEIEERDGLHPPPPSKCARRDVATQTEMMEEMHVEMPTDIAVADATAAGESCITVPAAVETLLRGLLDQCHSTPPPPDQDSQTSVEPPPVPAMQVREPTTETQSPKGDTTHPYTVGSSPSPPTEAQQERRATTLSPLIYDLSHTISDAKFIGMRAAQDDYKAKAKAYKHALQAVEARLQEEAVGMEVSLPKWPAPRDGSFYAQASLEGGKRRRDRADEGDGDVDDGTA